MIFSLFFNDRAILCIGEPKTTFVAIFLDFFAAASGNDDVMILEERETTTGW